ncbi:hypothetical protein CNMCM5793_007024 [Aspergillus hiratsukae]|uniref:DUF7514 domain-containing protein n=1 Tax=Aspergillus hiratsukae TaxID=1194566 RepID=A0A8H6PZQ8_9EURO|nr:hypothetical protein CNMCM5793_007024 [Aspergillus hiratsukae]KAF7163132.1 hypothetical protein CNMCM6106_000167 [Aspergillus hiratsukae]
MSSAQDANAGANFWGVLINPDKSPAPLLEQLCLGIAQLMVTFDEYATTDLTPDRMAAFYRKVGGNYDILFLETKSSALSFIYQRLGCFHSIQPTNDPFKPPSIPALQPNGFVRWQTIQLLLDPDEHARYLQNAVALWDIETPNGGTFPKTIPRDAFPSEPDPEMVEWHEGVSRRFEFDYWRKNVLRSSPPNFRTYHSQFSQKDASPAQEHHTSSHRPATPPPRRHTEPEDPPRRSRHNRQRSGELPTSATRRVKSTYFPRAEERPEFASSRAPSPPIRPRQSAKSRGRERPHSFVYPTSTEPHHGQDTSDASSEDSGSPTQGQPPRSGRRSHPRNLSLPRSRSSHARRHSHEAYARRTEQDVSADSPRRHTHRDVHTAHTGRLYDSDGARKPRHSRAYNEEPTPSRSAGVRFHEHIFHEQPAVTPSPEVPLYAHVHPRYMDGISENYVHHHHNHHIDSYLMEDGRRHSYRDPTSNGSGAHAAGVEHTRSYAGRSSRVPGWASPPQGSKRCVPVQMVDAYASPSGRRSAMYER